MHELQDAYILHMRNFSDSKVLIEFLTSSLGRVKAVARVPSKKNRAQYQSFQLLNIAVRGTAELKTLVHCEVVPDRTKCLDFKGISLFCAMYINELVQRVTPLEEADQGLFVRYEWALERLVSVSDTAAREAILREFELELLSALGYQINFFEVPSSGKKIEAGGRYHYGVETGFEEVESSYEQGGLEGEYLLAIGNRDLSHPHSLKIAKRITRVALAPLLGSKPLKSRELFR